MLWQFIQRLFAKDRFYDVRLDAQDKRLTRLEQTMVTKEEFDAAQSAYFAKVAALIAKINAHPAAADFSDELAALNAAASQLPTDDTTTAPTGS